MNDDTMVAGGRVANFEWVFWLAVSDKVRNMRGWVILVVADTARQ